LYNYKKSDISFSSKRNARQGTQDREHCTRKIVRQQFDSSIAVGEEMDHGRQIIQATNSFEHSGSGFPYFESKHMPCSKGLHCIAAN